MKIIPVILTVAFLLFLGVFILQSDLILDYKIIIITVIACLVLITVHQAAKNI